jgi:hypothetical protein
MGQSKTTEGVTMSPNRRHARCVSFASAWLLIAALLLSSSGCGSDDSTTATGTTGAAGVTGPAGFQQALDDALPSSGQIDTACSQADTASEFVHSFVISSMIGALVKAHFNDSEIAGHASEIVSHLGLASLSECSFLKQFQLENALANPQNLSP